MLLKLILSTALHFQESSILAISIITRGHSVLKLINTDKTRTKAGEPCDGYPSRETDNTVMHRVTLEKDAAIRKSRHVTSYASQLYDFECVTVGGCTHKAVLCVCVCVCVCVWRKLHCPTRHAQRRSTWTRPLRVIQERHRCLYAHCV
jgi:hypothetical protein